MSSRFLVLITILLAGVLFLAVGCQEQAKASEKSEAVTELKVVPGEVKDANGMPIITFEKDFYDFGDIGPDTKHDCEFKFRNSGKSILKIKKVQTTCGCTVASLDKMEYSPGESGVIKITYTANKHIGPVTKHITVYIDDAKGSTVMLTLLANGVQKVIVEPERLTISLKDSNIPEIKISSIAKVPFSIKGFSTLNDAITANYDPNVKATEFALKLKVDIEKLKQNLNGQIDIESTHPGAEHITVYFNLLKRFETSPPSITVFEVETGKPVTKEIWVQNNYKEDFVIESVTSEAGTVKTLSQEKIDNRYKLEVEMMPPADKGKGVFTDVLDIVMKGGEKLQVYCSGFYLKKQQK
jgi:limonene-1,2-epoxide hydrolase